MTESSNAITKAYDYLKWVMPVVSRFPKDKRYTLGQRIENKILDILELLLRANYSKTKLEILKNANLELETARYLSRLCFDLRFINLTRYEFSSRCLNEIGRLIGGWIKQQSKK